MNKVKVLFFAADPFSAPPYGRAPRLALDEDIRQILAKIRTAEHRDALEFYFRLAARTDDLLQALNEIRPQVVHFSGHGSKDGLVLVSADGLRPHPVSAAALGQVFKIFRGDIRVAVLNACFSLPQAEAIAGAVGCAIGTLGQISDTAAITFGASFYRALAFGASVEVAYNQASVALALEHFEDRECPQLVVRPGCDPGRLVLVSPEGVGSSRRGMRALGTAIVGLAIVGTGVFTAVTLAERASGTHTSPARDSVAIDASSPDTFSQASTPTRTVESERTRPEAQTKRRIARPAPAEREDPPPEEPQNSASTPIIRPSLENKSSLPVVRDTAPNLTIQPDHPR